ncbi:aspartate kinase [Desulfosudis oleivorans]|uniref:aspartate kinase n=1 Tax=Desulfosudis oleivorans (strain DSM 6200 / JCM 39069 / Hxd3) TaxID=96561 RepID=A8ZWG1_DESOH|nr:aspartate kinase [Desulfosudis oleivorans]ABW66769.1 aspartate/glutamate/uridylate kinase [Desulfosudis oleivorans Hxd3]
MGNHTVEKIGGTAMSQFDKVLDNIIVGDRKEKDLYNRIIVVSAYGGITNELLEHKKTSDSGVYSLFSKDDDSWAWGEAITRVGQRMCTINKGFEHLGLDVQLADRFVKERIEGVRSCLIDLTRLCSFGHFKLDEHLMTVREMLSAIGEAHSAHNSYLILKSMGINARLMDLSGWMDTDQLSLDETIKKAFESVDVAEELPIVTGYTQCKEGIMGSYDRGYTEITFSRIAVLTGAREGIIHKEYHLSSGDPKIIGEDRVETIGSTNYDVADQLSDLGMEAIHPGAARGLRKTDIPLRVKNVFEPDHPGTLITNDYRSTDARVEIIAGRKGVTGIEVWDQDMVGRWDHDLEMLKHLAAAKIRYLAKDTNANTLTHYIAAPLAKIKRLTDNIKQDFPSADILVKKVALVSAIGTNMADTWVLPTAVHSLTNAGVEILGLHKCMRQVDIQFVVDEKDFQNAICALHRDLVETGR